MKKRRIVLASVLKPVDDTRMLEKMGMSLAGDGQYDVFIIGFPAKSIAPHPNIHAIPLKAFGRISWKRIIAPLFILTKIIKVKPNILLVNTHELLIVSVSYKILFGTISIYDIRENYYRNILFTRVYPFGIRHLLALAVRLKEILLAPFFNHFLLAEKAYQKEMTFFKARFTVLENKSLPQGEGPAPADKKIIQLLFSGTIDTSTGILEAIALAKELHRCHGAIRFSIVGFCARQHVRSKILNLCHGHDFIRLVGFDYLVPHQRIIEEIRVAHFGIIYYPPSPHTRNLRPTKLYEYMANRLPILTWQNQQYAQEVIANQAGLLVFRPASQLLTAMSSTPFYTKQISGIYWDGETFLRLIKRLEGKN